MIRTFLFPCLLIASLAFASNNSVNEACKRLCVSDGECLRKCVGHAELFELKADFINAAADWSPAVETRLKVLRSGASFDTLDICKQTGWSVDNKLTCLRSYPSPIVIKNCKKLSPLEDEQVRCMRSGKNEAEIEACMLLVPGSDLRIQCLQKQITAEETRDCRRMGLDSRARMACLNRVAGERQAENRAFDKELRQQVAAEKKFDEQQSRRPASRKSR